MKKLSFIILALVVLSVNVFATETVSTKTLDMAKTAYKASLSSDNAGVRNSALHNIVVVASKHPEFNAESFISSLKKMSNSDDLPYIRVNAKITIDLLNNTNLLEKLDLKEDDPKVFFNNAYLNLTNFYAVN